MVSVDSLYKHCNYFEVLVIKMSQSSSKSKASGARKQKSGGEEDSSKEKPDNFVWTDDEVWLLLKVTVEYKANKEMGNIDSEMKCF